MTLHFYFQHPRYLNLNIKIPWFSEQYLIIHVQQNLLCTLRSIQESKDNCHKVPANVQGRNCWSPEKERKQEKPRWGVCPSSSLLQVWLLWLAAKVNKIERMCIGPGWDGTNMLILSCNTLVSWAKYPDVLNPHSPISYLQATTESHQISNVCFPYFLMNFCHFLHAVLTVRFPREWTVLPNLQSSPGRNSNIGFRSFKCHIVIIVCWLLKAME